MTPPATMRAVQLTRYGGPEALVWRDVPPVPRPGPDEVRAAGVNATDIHTRIGWYGAGWQRGLVALIREGRVRPRVSQTCPLSRIAAAQADRAAGRGQGKLVLRPQEEDA